MNFFTQKTTWTNLEFIPLKICVASAYILIGAWFSDFVLKYYVLFWLLFAVSVIITMYMWVTKMKQSSENS